MSEDFDKEWWDRLPTLPAPVRKRELRKLVRAINDEIADDAEIAAKHGMRAGDDIEMQRAVREMGLDK